MAYEHGVRVLEQPTSIIPPLEGTAGLQVIFGTAPVNLATDPYAATNTPVIAYSYAEAVEQLGYSDNWDKDNGGYTLCQSIYANFKLANIAPVIFVNVLDPKKHKKTNEETAVPVEDLQATVPVLGILRDTVKIKIAGATEGSEDVTLAVDDDYILTFDDDGRLVVTLTLTGKGAEATSIKVTSTSIDPSQVDKDEVIGTYNPSTGTETGFEILRQIHPTFSMTPGLILAPGWSQIPDVGIVLAAKCEEINGYFRCECFVDIDSGETGCRVYSKLLPAKNGAGCNSIHAMALWPCVVSGSKKFWYSAVMAACTAYLDASNDDVPNLSPSNKLFGITGTVLADAVYTEGKGWDKEVKLDQQQGNTVNSFGITTAINVGGWRTWGNRSACYPASTDPKDAWFCCRRFFSWWGNSFILTYFRKVDDPMNRPLIESICDSENIRGKSYAAQGKCAGASIEYREVDNPVTDILNGKVTFRTHLAPYTPAEDILNILEFDPDTLKAALTGGN